MNLLPIAFVQGTTLGMTALDVVNGVLGLACFAMVFAVAVAAWRDHHERRRWHAMIPNGWPPEGTLEPPPFPRVRPSRDVGPDVARPKESSGRGGER